MKKQFFLLLSSLSFATGVFSQENFLIDTAVVPGQKYRTWAIGVHAGVVSPVVALGGSDDFPNWDASFAYGIDVRKQLSPLFALQLNVLSGELSGSTPSVSSVSNSNYKAFETNFAYAADIRLVYTLGAISFLRHNKSLLFNVSAGAGRISYSPVLIRNDFSIEDWRSRDEEEFRNSAYFPVSAGMKFKLSNVVAISLNYHSYFIDNDLLDGYAAGGASSKDKFSYGSMGLEMTLGKYRNKDLSWVNPAALFYDNVRYQKERDKLSVLRKAMDQVGLDHAKLTADEDGDGVSDFYDKCPRTPKGVVVDGAGCSLTSRSKDVPVERYSPRVKKVDVELKRVDVYK